MTTNDGGTVLVTGASAGLGEVFARRFAARGHGLVLVARRTDRLEALASDLRARHGTKTLLLGVDLGSEGGPADVHRRVGEAGLEILTLVNNAGYGNYGLFQDSDLRRELGQIDLNCRALVALTRLFLPRMLERKAGLVMHVGSVASFVPVPYLASYAATKAFVLSFTEALAAEVRGSGVHVMVVCPGGTRTEFQAVAGVDASLYDKTLMSSERVVDIAMRGMDRRKRVVVTGLANKAQALLGGMLPRGMVAWIARHVMEGTRKKAGPE
ncbi:MAG: SDR family oxidoreductase [Planctomycetes bacterium]|nr:SDR family oxidoreductase [Planctomycetota bacterium]